MMLVESKVISTMSNDELRVLHVLKKHHISIGHKLNHRAYQQPLRDRGGSLFRRLSDDVLLGAEADE